MRAASDTVGGTTAGATAEAVREAVRDRYAALAVTTTPAVQALQERRASGCCGGGEAASCGAAAGPRPDTAFGAGLYDDGTSGQVPAEALLASLGCGNPTAVADLGPGQTVLDLGAGGGIDVILSARRVGPHGRVIGLDMTEEMLDLARRNVEAAGVGNVELLRGTIEDVPLPDASVDVVISNCVVNLSPDKAAVLAEVARVLRPGGRVGISDVVAEDRLTVSERAERGDHVSCIAGALSQAEYLAGLREVGLVDASVTFTHEVADGLHGAIVRARKP